MGWQERFIRARRNRQKSEAQLAMQQLLLQGDGGVTTYGVVTENLLRVECSEWATTGVTCNSNGQAILFSKDAAGSIGSFSQIIPLIIGTVYTLYYRLGDSSITKLPWSGKCKVDLGGLTSPVKDQAGTYSFTSTATGTGIKFDLDLNAVGSVSDIVLVYHDKV